MKSIVAEGILFGVLVFIYSVRAVPGVNRADNIPANLTDILKESDEHNKIGSSLNSKEEPVKAASDSIPTIDPVEFNEGTLPISESIVTSNHPFYGSSASVQSPGHREAQSISGAAQSPIPSHLPSPPITPLGYGDAAGIGGFPGGFGANPGFPGGFGPGAPVGGGFGFPGGFGPGAPVGGGFPGGFGAPIGGGIGFGIPGAGAGAGAGVNMGINMGMGAGVDGWGIYAPIVMKVLAIGGMGLLILLMMAMIPGAMANGGWMHNLGAGIANSFNMQDHIDVGPYHKSGYANVNFNKGADIGLAHQVNEAVNKQF